MEHRKKTIFALALGIAFSLLFLLLIVLLRTVDVAAIGPGGTKVGLSRLNGAFRNWLGYGEGFNNALYQIAKWFGLLALALVAGLALMGIWQWVRRKSIWKVDKLLLATGVLYLVVGALYLFFELVVVNCRPVLMAGETLPEASFPSSHTVLACTVFGSAFWLIAKYLRGVWRILSSIACGTFLAAIVLGRAFSGVHWLTDILGGLFLSAALLCWFWFANLRLLGKEK